MFASLQHSQAVNRGLTAAAAEDLLHCVGGRNCGHSSSFKGQRCKKSCDCVSDIVAVARQKKRGSSINCQTL